MKLYMVRRWRIFNKENQTIEDIESILDSQKLKILLAKNYQIWKIKVLDKPLGKSGEYMLYTDFQKKKYFIACEDLKSKSFLR